MANDATAEGSHKGRRRRRRTAELERGDRCVDIRRIPYTEESTFNGSAVL